MHRVIAEDDPLPPVHDLWRPAADLGALYRAEAPRLTRFLAGQMPLDHAQDLVQRVFVRMTARFAGDAAREVPGSYLREAARNLIRDDARAAVRTSARLHLPLDETDLADGDPVAALEARDRLARIEQAVLRLKPLTRQIFLARRVDGYSYQEIARRTGLSVRGVEKQMSRALRQLGRHLRDDA